MKYVKWFSYGVAATIVADVILTILTVSKEIEQADLFILDELD